MNQRFDFSLTRPEEEHPALLDAVEAFAAELGLDAAMRFRLGLVIDEMVANCVEHGPGPGQERAIRVEVVDNAHCIAVEITAIGPPFDPTRHEFSACRDTDDIRIGGVGICLICNLAAEVTYSRRGNANHTRIVLEKPTQEPACNSDR